MYKYCIFYFLTILLSTSCRNEKALNAEATAATTEKSPKYFPDDLTKVFDAHGSLTQWNAMKTLSYEIVREGGNEKQLIDLHTRNERIEASNYKTGYNGKDYWLEADTSYKGNPKFYHNLMFYFYAMPFVLADDGIIFSDTDTLEFEGNSYPGIRISYDDGVGVSPEDEYFIHYNPKTFQMEWLGYTVTFFSGKKSKKVKWIRYNDWKSFEGLLLPKSMTWYKMEEGKITEPKKPTQFVNVTLSQEPTDSKNFEKTKGAVIVE